MAGFHFFGRGIDRCQRRRRKATKGSQTPGKQKKGSCVAEPLDKWAAKTSRSYKDKDYAKFVAKCIRYNPQKG